MNIVIVVGMAINKGMATFAVMYVIICMNAIAAMSTFSLEGLVAALPLMTLMAVIVVVAKGL